MPGLPASKEISIEISTTLGSISATIQSCPKPKAILVLAHGAGAGKDHPFMKSLALALASESMSTFRFNFLYMEHKKGRPDPAPIAEKTVEVVLQKAYELFPDIPLFGSGKSFGGRMTSQRLSKDCPPWVKGIVFYGFPLHPAGAPATDRAKHLDSVHEPMLFLQGTRDTLAELTLIKEVISKLTSATLVLFEGADHSFKVKNKEIINDLALKTSSWVDSILANPAL